MFSKIKARTTESSRVIFPQRTMISLHTCMSCLKVGRVPYRCVMMGQDPPDPVMIFCEEKACIQNAYNGLYRAITEFIEPYHTRWYGKVDCLVKRSSGAIEGGWHITHIAFNTEGIYKVVVYSSSANLQKAVSFQDFCELNPDLVEKVTEIGTHIVHQIFSKFENDF